MKHRLEWRLLCMIRLYELHHESPDCCCIRVTWEQDHGYVFAVLWFCYGSCISQKRSCAVAAVPARRE